MIDGIDFERLARIGLNAPVQQTVLAQTDITPADELFRVVRVERDQPLLHDGEQVFPARVLPGVLARLQDDQDALAVGDWVLARRNEWQQWWVFGRIPPLNQLARRLQDGREKATRAVIVSNVDTACLTMGLDLDFNLRRLQRYLALAQVCRVPALVVLTKADLCPQPQDLLAEVEAVLPQGVMAVAVDAQSDSAVIALAPWLGPGQTLVFLGSSGAGKSTLTNTLLGAEVQSTGGVRKGDGRGRHTTTARSLHRLPSGACVIDTPGVRTLRLDTDAQAVDAVFHDVAELAQACRFSDCTHQSEPGCAVRDQLDAERLRGFHKLRREAERDTLSVLQQRERLAQWKARGRMARERMRA
jgi:ribosome biogenesis GTPase / thiamine phosphate phosphatase